MGGEDPLQVDNALVQRWLVSFLRDEVVLRRGFKKGIVGLSGGVDSALTAFLAVEALGRENVIAVRLPYRTSSQESLAHAQLVIDKLGITALTVDITAARNKTTIDLQQIVTESVTELRQHASLPEQLVRLSRLGKRKSLRDERLDLLLLKKIEQGDEILSEPSRFQPFKPLDAVGNHAFPTREKPAGSDV